MPIQKKFGSLFNAPHIYIYIYMCVCVCVCVCVQIAIKRHQWKEFIPMVLKFFNQTSRVPELDQSIKVKWMQTLFTSERLYTINIFFYTKIIIFLGTVIITITHLLIQQVECTRPFFILHFSLCKDKSKVLLKFCVSCCNNITWPKQFKLWKVLTVLGSIMMVSVLTCFTSCDLKTAQMKISSSSSCRATSTDIPDPYRSSPLVHHLWKVFRATSRILT